MGNKIFHKNWPFSLRFREAQPCSDYTLCQPGSPLSPLTGNECLIFLWRRLPPMMGAASPPPSRRLSCFQCLAIHMTPNFRPRYYSTWTLHQMKDTHSVQTVALLLVTQNKLVWSCIDWRQVRKKLDWEKGLWERYWLWFRFWFWLRSPQKCCSSVHALKLWQCCSRKSVMPPPQSSSGWLWYLQPKSSDTYWSIFYTDI